MGLYAVWIVVFSGFTDLLLGVKGQCQNMCGSRGGGGAGRGSGPPPPPENYKNIGFLQRPAYSGI